MNKKPNEDEIYIDNKNLEELQSLKKLIIEKIHRDYTQEKCTCKGFFKPLDCPIHGKHEAKETVSINTKGKGGF